MSTAHDSNNSGTRYTVPNRNDPMGGFSPRGPPRPDLANPNVVHFSASGAAIREAEVLDHMNTPLYHFNSTGERHLEMSDSEGRVVGKFDDGVVSYGTNDDVKVKRFIDKKTANTGAVLTHDGQTYEFVQEIFYAIVRTTPENVRVGIVYNYSGKPAVELVGDGLQIPGLQAHIVFATALMESGVTKKEGALGKAFRNIIPGKKKL